MNQEIDVNAPISTIIETGTVIFVSHGIEFFLIHHFSAIVSSRAQLGEPAYNNHLPYIPQFHRLIFAI